MEKISVLDTFHHLGKVLKAECGSGPVYYCPNPGNWGDALIRHGTAKFFHDLKLDYREITAEPRPKNWRTWFLPYVRGGTVIYGGGGAWCRFWTTGRDHVVTYKRRFKVIVLPSTYDLVDPMPDVTFFCRDRFESQQNVPSATFCHDMAFYIQKDFQGNKLARGAGYFFRTDKESAGPSQNFAKNRDLSLEGKHLTPVSPFFEAVNQFAEIYTDRLHVAIAGCLLGKVVHLYAGAYFKNRAVYLSSMKDYFKNVHFHGNFDVEIPCRKTGGRFR